MSPHLQADAGPPAEGAHARAHFDYSNGYYEARGFPVAAELDH